MNSLTNLNLSYSVKYSPDTQEVEVYQGKAKIGVVEENDFKKIAPNNVPLTIESLKIKAQKLKFMEEHPKIYTVLNILSVPASLAYGLFYLIGSVFAAFGGGGPNNLIEQFDYFTMKNWNWIKPSLSTSLTKSMQDLTESIQTDEKNLTQKINEWATFIDKGEDMRKLKEFHRSDIQKWGEEGWRQQSTSLITYQKMEKIRDIAKHAFGKEIVID